MKSKKQAKLQPFSPKITVIIVVLFVFFRVTPSIAKDINDLANKLITLRGEVDSLSSSLEDAKAQTRDQLRSLSRQKADLESQIQREKLRIKQLKQSLESQKESLATTSKLGDKLSPVISQALSNIKTSVKTGMPFKQNERLGELSELQSKLSSGTLPPSTILARLWAFIEDELRLTKESGLYRQTINLNGKEVLADVARVGMIMLFFKTSDDQVGMATSNVNGWNFSTIENPDSKELVMKFFDSLKKQIRQGYFTLPNALPKALEVNHE